MDLPLLLLLVGGLAAGMLIGWHNARIRYWRAGHMEGQRVMKQRVREEINQNISLGNILLRFRDGSALSAEQLLDFMCHGKQPDFEDPTRGVAGYNPH